MAGPAIRSWIRGNLIGAGAFGKVNLAVNREDGEVFAVKSVQVDSSDAGAKVSLNALENEVELLQSLDSKFVVKCLGSDWSEESGKLLRNVFLEYMPEGCLTDFLKQFSSVEPLDEHLIRTYTRSIVQGIDYLHSNGIVHCDIKGKNILVGNGSVKLTDFGSAKRVGEAIKVEAEDLSFAKVNGTPLWMAPEVVRQVEQGPASDIWSLGCTVVEMATGKSPWSDLANSFAALYHIGCTDEIPAVPASLSPQAHDFLSQCFQRDPRKRWTSGQLLEHPFLTTCYTPYVRSRVPKAPSSPTSVMQFPSGDSNSGLSSVIRTSVPILEMPSFSRRGLVGVASSDKLSEKSQEHEDDKWMGSSPLDERAGQWIVVRSPKGSPRSSSPSSFLEMKGPVLEAPLSAPKSKDPVSDDITAFPSANVNCTGFCALEQCSCSSSEPVQTSPETELVFALSRVSSKVSSARSFTKKIGAVECHNAARPFKALVSGVLRSVEDNSVATKGVSACSRPFLTSVNEDRAPCISDGFSFLYSSKSAFEVRGLQIMEPNSYGAQCDWFVECRRMELNWDHLGYVFGKLFGPWDHCTTLHFNANSLQVKFRTSWRILCICILLLMVVLHAVLKT